MTSGLPNSLKAHAYRNQLARYKKAVENEFYLEAVFIACAMLEDRLRAFLFHCGLTDDSRMAITSNKAVNVALGSQLGFKPGKKTRLEKISQKTDCARNLLKLGPNPPEVEPAGSIEFLSALRHNLQQIPDQAQLLAALNEINDWMLVRNELVHDLIGKQPAGISLSLASCAEDGYRLARIIDAAVKALRETPNLREQFSIH